MCWYFYVFVRTTYRCKRKHMIKEKSNQLQTPLECSNKRLRTETKTAHSPPFVRVRLAAVCSTRLPPSVADRARCDLRRPGAGRGHSAGHVIGRPDWTPVELQNL